jgi:hypothetical protein
MAMFPKWKHPAVLGWDLQYGAGEIVGPRSSLTCIASAA